MRVARGGGILSTFFTWKEGSEQSGVLWEEIDLEVFGKNDATTWQSNILTGSPRKGSEQVHRAGASLAEDYHTYAIEWTPDYVAWFFDGNQVRKTTGGQARELTNQAGIRFNLWAAFDANWAGAWYDDVLPQYQFVNWVKYYGTHEGQFTLEWVDDFDSLNNDRWGKANWTFAENRADFDPQNIVIQDGTLVLCLTKEGETGFNGDVPPDHETAIADHRFTEIPQRFSLGQNYPNPFNPQTTIPCSISESSRVILIIVDRLGREVRTLVNEEMNPGFYSMIWDGRDNQGKSMPSGPYLYCLREGSRTESRKMILLQ